MKNISTRNLPIKSYADADAFLRANWRTLCKRANWRTLCNNTRVEYIDHFTRGVKLHATTIVYYHSDGTITLNSGGYRTVTTKARMNQLLPDGYRVNQNNFEWSVRTPNGELPFEDGIRLAVGQ